MESDIDTPFGSVPFPDNSVGRAAETRWSERQSRLSLMVEGNVNPAIKLTGYGEFDFLGAAQTANWNQSNSYQPRVRHLYAGVDDSDLGFACHRRPDLVAGDAQQLLDGSTEDPGSGHHRRAVRRRL